MNPSATLGTPGRPDKVRSPKQFFERISKRRCSHLPRYSIYSLGTVRGCLPAASNWYVPVDDGSGGGGERFDLGKDFVVRDNL